MLNTYKSSKKYTARNLWLIVSCLMIFSCAFFPENTLPYPYIASPVMNAMHLPAGFFLVLASHISLPYLRKNSWLLLCLGGTVFGLIEILQPLVGRTSSWQDFLLSLLGVALAYALLHCVNTSHRIGIAVSSVISLSIFVTLLAPGLASITYAVEVNQQFPVLENFDTKTHRLTLSGKATNRVLIPSPLATNNNGRYLRINNDASRWPGASLNIIHKNWRGYQALCFDAKSEVTNTWLRVRLDDQLSIGSHSSSTHRLNISDQWEKHCLSIETLITPSQRSIDISQMKQLVFFTHRREAVKYVELDNIRVVETKGNLAAND